MKLNTWMWIVGAGVAVVGGAVLLDRFVREAEVANRSEIDSWVDKMLSQELARKLAQPTDAIHQILTGTPADELITLISNTVHAVTLTFTRLSTNRDVQIRLDLVYEDGTSFSTTTERNWDNLPESIRAEFIRGGREIAYRTWEFPWVNTVMV